MEMIYIFAGVILIFGVIAYVAYLHEQKRIAEFEKIAAASGDMYHGKESNRFYDRIAGRGYKLFSIGRSRKVTHLFEVPFNEEWMVVFEYKYTTGSGKHSQTHQYHAVVLESDKLPSAPFSIKRERLIHQIKPTLGMTTKDIDFDMYPDFSERFFLAGEDETAVRAAFSDEVIRWFENRGERYEVTMQYEGLLLHTKGKLSYEAIEKLKRDGKMLHDLLSRSAKADKFNGGWGDEHDWWE